MELYTIHTIPDFLQKHIKYLQLAISREIIHHLPVNKHDECVGDEIGNRVLIV